MTGQSHTEGCLMPAQDISYDSKQIKTVKCFYSHPVCCPKYCSFLPSHSRCLAHTFDYPQHPSVGLRDSSSLMGHKAQNPPGTLVGKAIDNHGLWESYLAKLWRSERPLINRLLSK